MRTGINAVDAAHLPCLFKVCGEDDVPILPYSYSTVISDSDTDPEFCITLEASRLTY